MHRLLVIILSVMLIVAPVSAQEPTPTRPPAQGELASATREFTDASDRIGTQNVIMIVVVVGVLIIGGITFRPLLKSNSEASAQIVTMSAQTANTQLLSAQALERTAQEMGRLAKVVEGLETKKEAQDSRKLAVEDIDHHTDQLIQPIDSKLQTVAATLEELKRTVVTKQVLDATINPLVERIDAALQVIHDLQQPQQSPAPTPPAGHDMMDAVEKG